MKGQIAKHLEFHYCKAPELNDTLTASFQIHWCKITKICVTGKMWTFMDWCVSVLFFQ